MNIGLINKIDREIGDQSPVSFEFPDFIQKGPFSLTFPDLKTGC